MVLIFVFWWWVTEITKIWTLQKISHCTVTVFAFTYKKYNDKSLMKITNHMICLHVKSLMKITNHVYMLLALFMNSLQELLRNVPGSVLMSSRYTELIATNDIKDIPTRVLHIQRYIIPYFTVEVPTCFDSYNQPRLGGGRLFEHAAIEPWKRPPKSISTLLPCSCINNWLIW